MEIMTMVNTMLSTGRVRSTTPITTTMESDGTFKSLQESRSTDGLKLMCLH
jgi:hypothetical protein